MEQLFIVVHRVNPNQYRADSVFTERRLADNHAEILRMQDTNPKWEYFVVDGTITSEPETTEQRIERGNQELGPFA